MVKEEEIAKDVLDAAAAFGYESVRSAYQFGKGLINETYRVEGKRGDSVLLQKFNSCVFQRPFDIQENYEAVAGFLTERHHFIPALHRTKEGALAWTSQQQEVWRAFEFVQDSYSPDLVKSTTDAAAVAGSFGRFTALLNDLPVERLKIIIPGFHDLQWRFHQFKESIKSCKISVSGEVKSLLATLLERANYVSIFRRFANETAFPARVMHHDCKISNLLFDRKTGRIICPVDLDTVMPGKFFSDPGDMVRTICCTVDENSTDWQAVDVNDSFYREVIESYLNEMGDKFTPDEKAHLHYSGLLLTYMQALRFITDYLNGNVYYKVTYEAQNFDRAKNQILFLQSLENYLQKTDSLKY